MKLFEENALPKYAILSHTWATDDEVSFQEMTGIVNDHDHPASSKPGYQKILSTCKKANSHGLRYAWVDTCCIDKTSSAELSQAINSMFKWYSNAKVCYTFLFDLRPNNSADSMRNCKWFTRGWTLQELIASEEIRFYNARWDFVGDKSSLKELLSDITNIDEVILYDSTLLYNIPVARRMSWASGRTTTRREDIAYSLLGIFDVNMPMLYGEGENAFMRLQEEIIKRSNDLTIFMCSAKAESFPESPRDPSDDVNTEASLSWSDSESDQASPRGKVRCYSRSDGAKGSQISYRELFARSPEDFAVAGGAPWHITEISRSVSRAYGFLPPAAQEFALTNNGLYLKKARLRIVASSSDLSCYVLALRRSSGYYGKEDYVLLQKVGPGIFVRLQGHIFQSALSKAYRSHTTDAVEVQEDAYIMPTASALSHMQLQSSDDHSIRFVCESYAINFVGRGFPEDRWDAAARKFITIGIIGDIPFEGYVKVSGLTLHGSAPDELMTDDWDCFYILCGRGWAGLYSSKQWIGRTSTTKKEVLMLSKIDDNAHYDISNFSCIPQKLRVGSIEVEALMSWTFREGRGYRYRVSVKIKPLRTPSSSITATPTLRSNPIGSDRRKRGS